MRVPVQDLEALGIETRKDAEKWMSRRLKIEVDKRVGEAAEVVDYEVEVEVRGGRERGHRRTPRWSSSGVNSGGFED